ncbi:uncharacterized protein LOC105664634 [Ceratitis capitata]|uniref:uncharacterized protein LOC105664634 n=1 Tax=Ceratitis capitata TaxID=7213 RepID=UPI0006189044|nr:uncharacterized protein LOC105664634 [Ceratitis capitata]
MLFGWSSQHAKHAQACADVKGKGTVQLRVAGGMGERQIEFKNTLFVPDLRTNLISVAKITDKGHTVAFYKTETFVNDASGKITFIADRRGDLYCLRENSECGIVQEKCSDVFKWHCRLGHLNAKDSFRILRNGVLPSIKFSETEEFSKCFERQKGQKMICLQSDNGREYCNNDFNQYLADHGILKRLSVPRTPEQNGLAERMNRTLMDMARCLLQKSGLGTSFWSEAVATSCFIRNKCPSSSIQWKTPYEKFYGNSPDLNYLKIFGSKDGAE